MVKEVQLNEASLNFKKIAVIILVAIFLIIVMLFMWSLRTKVCGDGTIDGECSVNKPYFCSNEILIEKASVCGCPEILEQRGEFCLSDYQANPEVRELDYFLNGKKGKIDFVVYRDFVDYLSDLPNKIQHNIGEVPSRQDFKLKKINEPFQREFLLPMVIEIQNLKKNKRHQAEIAISLVQNIPYGISDKKTFFAGQEMDYSRYPYEVLYDIEGICGERSELLAFLLKELGYGVSIFYYPVENHEAVGIKCSSYDGEKHKGYCYIETTTSLNLELSSEPEIIFISDGDSF